ncbi:MAG: TonB-dependent receptor [Rhodospirillales bacterium]|nr:TonB-dependent receptor [Rhodospirillales bacterium]
MASNKKAQLLRLCSAVATLALLADTAAAQTAGTEEITVTARKREERLQDVPDAINVFTSARIEDAHIQTVRDVAQRVPNVSFTTGEQPGLLLINVRGIGQVRNGEPPIAVVIDGVQLYNINQITQNLFDIEQIEVLKGPQGSVYGRNAIGGAINIVTKQPSNEFTGRAELEFATGNDRRASAAISGPLVEDKLFFRVSGSTRSFDGNIQNELLHHPVNGENDNAFRLQLVATPTDRLKLDFRMSLDSVQSGAAWYTLVPPGADLNKILPVTADRLGVSHRLMRDYSFKVDYEMPFATLTSISAYSQMRAYLSEDFDFLPADLLSAVQTQPIRSWSEEMRLTSPQGSALRWQVGGYVLKTDQKIDSEIFLRPGASFLFVPFPIPAPTLFGATRATDDNLAYAFFGQASYRVLPDVELTAGLRYDVDQRNETDRGTAGSPKFDRSYNALQPKFSATWFLTDQAMVYASFGKGFRSGGFNPSARITKSFEAEKNTNYEIGAKTSWYDKRLTLNAAAFFTDVDNRQVYTFDQISASQTISNPIPKAEIKGVELELNAKPVQGLELDLALGAQDSEITKYDPRVFAGTGAAGDFTGKKLPQVPTYTYAASIQYSWPVLRDVMLRARAEFNGSSDFYWEVDNLDKRNALNLINLRLTAEYKNFALGLFVENLANERYVLDYNAQRFSGAPLGNYTLPAAGLRSGVQLRVQF